MVKQKRKKSEKDINKKGDTRKFLYLTLFLTILILGFLIYLFVPRPVLIQEKVIYTPQTTTTFSFVSEEEQKKDICNPCFSYFKYHSYVNGSLVLKNGPQKIQITGVNKGTFIWKETFEADDNIIITKLPVEGSVEVLIKYKIKGSEDIFIDKGMINN